MAWKKIIMGLALTGTGILMGWYGFQKLSSGPRLSKAQKDAVELIGAQEQIASLGDDEITQEIALLEAQMRKDNLVVRMNQDLVSPKDRQEANRILTRLALLNVEQQKRKKSTAGL